MSVYASEANAGGSRYAQQGQSGGSAYAGKASGQGGRRKSKKGGLLSRIPGERLVARTLSDLADAAINTPAGVYYLGKGLATDPVGTVKAMGESTIEDFRHPLRHPGYTLLDLLGVAGGVAGGVGRVGAAAKALETGGSVGRALLRPTFGTRTLRVGDLKVHPETSRSALGAATQKLSDVALQKLADRTPGGRAENRLHRKVGKVVTQDARTAELLAKAPGAELIALGRRLNPAEQKALQIVAEEAPLEGRITATSARVTGAKDPAARARHQRELDLLHSAKPLLAEQDGKPMFAGKDAQKLNRVLGKMRQVAGSREELLKGLGLLTDEAIGSRKSKAGRAALGEPLAAAAGPEPPTPGQMSLLPEPAQPDLFQASPDAVRVPDVARRAPRSLERQGARIGAGGTIGHLREPGSVTHEYTAALREQGLRREDTTRLVGESSLEAAKYAGLSHIHDLVRQAAAPAPTRADDIAVRLDNLAAQDRLPLDVRQFLDNPNGYFQQASPTERASILDKVRERMFIDPKKLDPQTAAEFAQLEREGKIGWVPRSVLGDLAKPQAPLGAVVGSKPVRMVDAINNASRFAILYLKPAYAIPNLLGNAALTVLQQGFAAPANLARAVALSHRISPELAARVDTLMGEGFARAISAHGQGKGAKVVDAAAGAWSKGVDIPFRRSSFIYEARRAGYHTPAELEKLLTDPAHTDDLPKITQKANREIIDYGNLSPVEREVVRRVVFFYPWIKGSTVYAGRLLREHPVQAAALGQVAKEGQQQTQAELGPVPSYLDGIFPAPDALTSLLGVNQPATINPAAAAIFQTPAQVGQALGGLAAGNVTDAAELSNFLSPALSLALAEIGRRNLRTGHEYPRSVDAAGIAKDTLIGSLPQTRLYEAATGSSRSVLYPPSLRAALLQYMIGGVAPREINLNRLRALARQEQTQLRR